MAEPEALSVGDEVVVDALRIAHGGHCVAHAAGRTLFVRYTVPGERVRVRITEVTRRIARSDAVEVLTAAAERVDPPCAWFGPGGCGGCDFQHVRVDGQRALKADVLVDTLRHVGHLPSDEIAALGIEVRELPGFADGLGWRTRVGWATGPGGVVGLRRFRSHDIVPVDRCLIAAADVAVPPAAGADPAADGRIVERIVGGRRWRVRRGDFWQVHPAAPAALVAAVLRLGAPVPGEHWWDLYSGAGLFAAFVGEAVGPTGRVDAVEAVVDSVRAARRALHDLPEVRLHVGDVKRWLPTAPGRPDGVVLDPPRTGAGRRVVEEIADRAVPRIVYVACDPAALARDAGLLRARGYHLAAVEAYDAFPMTHHVETVALFRRP